MRSTLDDKVPAPNDLVAEAMTATQAVRQEHINRLITAGISPRALAMSCTDRLGFGVLPVRELPDAMFEPSPTGQPHLILPVSTQRFIHDDDAGWFEPIDLIALHTVEPERWLWRTGKAWALGVEHLDKRAPLRVVTTPLDWIAAEGSALCVLDWSAPAWCWELVRSELQLVFPDNRLRARLTAALAQNVVLPDMEVARAA